MFLAEGHLQLEIVKKTHTHTSREAPFTISIPIPFSCCSEKHFINEALYVSSVLIPLSVWPHTGGHTQECFHLLGPCMNEACSIAASPWTELFNLASKWEVLMLSERLMTEALQASRSQLNQYF